MASKSTLKRWFKRAVRRPPGPSILHMLDEGQLSNYFWSLEYPLKLIPKYGDMLYISLSKQYIVMNPEAFEYILKTNHKNYQRDQVFYVRRIKPTFGNSLLVTDGNPWKHKRKLALPGYQQAALKTYLSPILHYTEQLVNQWQSEKAAKKNISLEMNLLTLKIALQIFCHREFSDHSLKRLGASIEFCNQYSAQAAFIHPLKPTINNMRYYWHLKKIDRFVEDIIHERRLHPSNHTDLLELLLKGEDVLAELKTHLITGHETTACALSWMWYLLAKHPRYQQQLQAEVDHTLKGHLPTLEDVPNLPLTKAIISETLRLYPPIWSTIRTNIEADMLGGFEIPAGSHLLLHIYALHRHPYYWEKPQDFYPERFLNPAPACHSFAYLPFIAGPHTCIASHLAMLEATLITSMLAQKFTFSLLSKTKAIPDPCISLRSKNGIRLMLKRRT